MRLIVVTVLALLTTKWGLVTKRLLVAVVERLLAALVHPAILPGFEQGKVINHDFSNVHPLPLLVLVVPGLDPAIESHQGALVGEVAEVFSGFTPDDTVDEVRIPITILVPELPINCERK